jgi:hypothetical protein
MFRRLLFAGLAVLACATVTMADVHRNEEHQFEAGFPTAVERVSKPIENGGKIVMAYSKDNTHIFMLGAAVETGVDLDPDQLSEFSKAFIEGIVNTRKNASITKEEELKLSDNTPKGNSYVVKHDGGWMYAWATIENNKGYFVVIEATTEEGLKDDVATKFQKSVKIKGVK